MSHLGNNEIQIHIVPVSNMIIRIKFSKANKDKNKNSNNNNNKSNEERGE